ISTVNSVKGYDAPYVLVASANEFRDSVEGRAAFYVACTRARYWLEVHHTNGGPIDRGDNGNHTRDAPPAPASGIATADPAIIPASPLVAEFQSALARTNRLLGFG
ncbi:MAG: hypothetical protein ACOC0P_04325, partial [Planctomycetota bacterium]